MGPSRNFERERDRLNSSWKSVAKPAELPLLLRWENGPPVNGVPGVMSLALDLSHARAGVAGLTTMSTIGAELSAEQAAFRRIRPPPVTLMPYLLRVKDLEITEESPSFSTESQGRFPTV